MVNWDSQQSSDQDGEFTVVSLPLKVLSSLTSPCSLQDIEPEILLEWLAISEGGDCRDLQLLALEQLCMILLISDNVDKVFER